MTESERKYIVDLAAVCGEKRGTEAAELVREYTLSSLGLLENDTINKVWLDYQGFCEWWIKPISMEINVDADGKKSVNGGYRTKLSDTFNKHSQEDVRANRGTGVTREPKLDADGNPVKKQAKAKGLPVYGVRLHMEDGGVEFMLQVGTLVFGFKEDRLTVGGLLDISQNLYMLTKFVSDPGTFLKLAKEYDADGNEIKNAWKMGAYTSDAATAELAKAAIIKQAVDKGEYGDVVTLASSTPVRQGASIKSEFIEKWVPKPKAKEVTAPTQPSETPSTLDVRLVDEGLTVPAAESQPA